MGPICGKSARSWCDILSTSFERKTTIISRSSGFIRSIVVKSSIVISLLYIVDPACFVASRDAPLLLSVLLGDLRAKRVGVREATKTIFLGLIQRVFK